MQKIRDAKRCFAKYLARCFEERLARFCTALFASLIFASALESSPLDSAPIDSRDSSSRDSSTATPAKAATRAILGDILHPYASFGIVGGGATHTDNTQSMSKEVATYPSQICYGDTTSARYEGSLKSGYNLEIGAEYFFDKWHIGGIRLFGEMSSIGGGLGNKVAGSDNRDTSTNNIPAGGIDTIKPGSGGSTTVYDDKYTFRDTPDAQAQIANNGTWQTFGIGIDGMLNVPIDSILKRYVSAIAEIDNRFSKNWFLRRIPYLKVGLFAGGGVEFSSFSQDSYTNEVAAKGKKDDISGIKDNDAFLAANSGGFLRYGVQIYLTRFFRVNFGYKKSFYKIASERWYGFYGRNLTTAEGCTAGANGLPPACDGVIRDEIWAQNQNFTAQSDTDSGPGWSEALLRQKFVLSKGDEWFLTFALSF